MFKVSNKDNSVDMKHSKPSFVKVKKDFASKKKFFLKASHDMKTQLWVIIFIVILFHINNISFKYVKWRKHRIVSKHRRFQWGTMQVEKYDQN